MTNEQISELFAKQSIRDVLSRYCRGLDRMDKAMAYSVFHADAPVNYFDIFEGTGHGFIDWVWGSHEAMQCHSHQINNVLVEVQGDTASSEAYVTVALQMKPELTEKPTEILARGRYLDKWKCIDGVWAISERLHIVDAQSTYHPAHIETKAESRRDTEDASYQFITQ